MPLFMIHGNGVDHRILKPFEQTLLSGEIFELHNIDLPGFGECPPLDGVAGLPELADWLESTIESVTAGAPFALLGNSMGGLLCQEMADRFADNVQGIFLLATAVFPQAESRTLPEQAVVVHNPALLDSLPETEAQLFSDIAVVQTEQSWHDFSQWVLPGLKAANLRAMAKLSRRYFLDPLPLDRDFQLTVPVRIVCARQDHVTGYEDQSLLLNRYPDARVSIIDAAGHNVHIDQPEAVQSALRSWVDEVHDYQRTK